MVWFWFELRTESTSINVPTLEHVDMSHFNTQLSECQEVPARRTVSFRENNAQTQGQNPSA